MSVVTVLMLILHVQGDSIWKISLLLLCFSLTILKLPVLRTIIFHEKCRFPPFSLLLYLSRTRMHTRLHIYWEMMFFIRCATIRRFSHASLLEYVKHRPVRPFDISPKAGSVRKNGFSFNSIELPAFVMADSSYTFSSCSVSCLPRKNRIVSFACTLISLCFFCYWLFFLSSVIVLSSWFLALLSRAMIFTARLYRT